MTDPGVQLVRGGFNANRSVSKLSQAQLILGQQPFAVLGVDSRIATIPGADFCFGIGIDLKEAEVSLKRQKELRKASR
jgi:hypothetical protein